MLDVDRVAVGLRERVLQDGVREEPAARHLRQRDRVAELLLALEAGRERDVADTLPRSEERLAVRVDHERARIAARRADERLVVVTDVAVRLVGDQVDGPAVALRMLRQDLREAVELPLAV